MKAIITKYHGPTATRGSRISARAEGVPVASLPYDHSMSAEGNHEYAAKLLADTHAWLKDGSRLRGGALPDGTGYAFVFVREERP